MVTKKLKHFEYGSHTDHREVESSNYDGFDAFDTPNGYCFVICDGHNEIGSIAKDIAIDRIRYFLEKEYVDDPYEAVQSALLYAGGYIYEYARKNEDYFGKMSTSCLCIIIRENKIYYASVGNCNMYLFDGRRFYLLVQEAANNVSNHSQDDSQPEFNTGNLLGSEKAYSPFVCDQPLVPLNDDIILLCTDGFYNKVSEKNVKKILTDPMPVQTKAIRLTDMAKEAGGEDSIALQIISFYNLEHDTREFLPFEEPQKDSLPKPFKINLPGNPLLNKIIIALVIIFAGYMFYDLFLFNPRPAKTIDNSKKEIALETIDDEKIVAKEKTVKIFDLNSLLDHYAPSDTLYNVRSGDTWSSVYRIFEVCSWFIRDHKNNVGRFDRQGNPVAGTRIHIPLRYSANQKLNPVFYKEFTTDKVGGSCQYADTKFIEGFHESIKQQFIKQD